ncbi:MAG: PaaI family thioesterase, partial [Acidimicrobiales bacterium]
MALTPEEQAQRRAAMRDIMTRTNFMSGLGLVIEEWSETGVRMRLPFDEKLTNDGAVYHGGSVASLVDSAGAGAVWA